LFSIIFLQIAAAKDPDTSFFKKLDGFQPCELTELKAGTHTFAVYGNTYFYAQLCLLCLLTVIILHRNWSVKFLLGDNFFKSATYTIEVLCAAPFSEEKENLRNVEAQILSKRAEISKFESEYREVCTLISALQSICFSLYHLIEPHVEFL
jgi:hypothetical protein